MEIHNRLVSLAEHKFDNQPHEPPLELCMIHMTSSEARNTEFGPSHRVKFVHRDH